MRFVCLFRNDTKSLLRRKTLPYNRKSLFNVIILLAGIGVSCLHIFCKDSCLYLKGSVFGFSLDYLGIAYVCILIISHLLGKNLVFLLLLSSGIGAEVYLLGFQMSHGVYCYYCLAFGALLFLLFFLNFDRSRKIFIAVSLLTGFVLFSIFFEGSVTPAYAEDSPLPSFGNGPVKVRLYTDYFCNPCRALEPKLEPTIKSLMKKGRITLTFIDTPVHPQTTLYAKFFLYALNNNRDFDNALRARSVLFEASNEKIAEKEKLEDFIRKKGVKIRPFDASPVFSILSGYLKEDMINATPTCVILKNGKKERFTGLDIVKALETLR